MKSKVFMRFGLFIILISMFTFGCSVNEEENLWKESSGQNTFEAYKAYLLKFPSGTYVQNAHDGIQKLYFNKAEANIELVWSIYDEYIAEYPQGSYKALFETIIYNQAILENTLESFEGYVKRYPNGLYVKEFETVIYKSIKDGESELTLEDFVLSFPTSALIPEIDDHFYSLARQTSDEANMDKYMTLFPEGKHIEDVKLNLEDIKYKKVIQSGSAKLIMDFIEKFPESKYIKILKINTTPDSAALLVSDLKDINIITTKSPGTLKALEGTTIKLAVESSGFKSSISEYVVTSENEQTVHVKLDGKVATIHFDNFDGKSIWEYKSQYNNFVVKENGFLGCEVKDYQFQQIKGFSIDFGKDFTLEMSFRFKNPPNDTKSYVGFLWGKTLSFNYFFISDNGKYGYGKTESRFTTVENINGYSNWYHRSDNSDRWFTSNNFSKTELNKLVLERRGDKYIYEFNGQTLFIEDIIGISGGSSVGIGMGDAVVEIDYIKILQ